MPSAPRGCQVVGESGQGLIDIVYVHGIRGDPQKTWTARGVPPKRASRFSLFRNRQETTTPEAQNDAAGRDVFWPRDLLLNQLNNVRVVTFGYDADVSSFLSKTSDRSIFSIAQDLVTRLEMLRESTDKVCVSRRLQASQLTVTSDRAHHICSTFIGWNCCQRCVFSPCLDVILRRVFG